MNPEMRHQFTMLYEGQALAMVGQNGQQLGAAYARCVIDGAMNALIRIEGAEEASKFAFALCDRVAGGIREPTSFPLIPPSASAPPPARSLAKRWAECIAGFLRGFDLIAWVFGFLAGLSIGANLR